MSGDTFALPLPPDFSQVHAIVVGRPLMLRGTYDYQRIYTLKLTAEDGAVIPLTYRQGKWRLTVQPRWLTLGFHWLKMQGGDRQGQTVTQEYFYFHVHPDLAGAAAPLAVKTVAATWFKQASQDSSQLNRYKKAHVPAGRAFIVERYAQRGSQLQVQLRDAIEPVGCYGYFDIKNINLNHGGVIKKIALPEVQQVLNDVTQLKITRTTWLKTQIVDSEELPQSQKQQLIQGQVLSLEQVSECGDYWQVALPASPLPRPTYVAAQDVQICPAEQFPKLSTVPNQPEHLWPLLSLQLLARILCRLGYVNAEPNVLCTEWLQWCCASFGAGAHTDRRYLLTLLKQQGVVVDQRDDWTLAALRSALAAQRTVILFSRLTPMLHWIELCDVETNMVLLDDPWGDATTGYCQMDGQHVQYPLAYFTEMVGPDGQIRGLAF